MRSEDSTADATPDSVAPRPHLHRRIRLRPVAAVVSRHLLRLHHLLPLVDPRPGWAEGIRRIERARGNHAVTLSS